MNNPIKYDIETGNTLIAIFECKRVLYANSKDPTFEFDDVKLVEGDPYDCDQMWSYQDQVHRSQLKYHESWEWLMPVVEKIESLKPDGDYHFNVVIGFNSYCGIGVSIRGACKLSFESGHPINDIQKGIYGTQSADNKIQAVWIAVTRFITWYNNNIKSK